MLRMLATIAVLLLTITPAEAALADRAQYPAAEWGYLYYLSTSHLDGELRSKTEAALAFTVASSSQQQIAEKATPVKVADGLYRLDLRDLQWDWRQWHRVVASYPYAHGLQLVYRGDWLVTQLGDTTGSDAYYRLLYGREKLTRGDFLKTWGVNNDVTYHFGVIVRSQAALGPSVAGIRLVENRPTNTRGSAWGTRDSAKIDERSDPLEHLDNRFRHDAEEHIVAMPKQSLTTGERGALMAFLLSDAKGVRQEEAPPKIVTDHLRFRNQAAIRNFGSCVGCHASGYLDPGVSELRTYITSGADVYATPKKLQEQIERFHLSDAGKQLRRDNEDFQAGVKMVNGLDGEANAEAFRGVFEFYDADLSLSTAAAELYTTPEEFRLALAWSNNLGYSLGARLSALPHGGTISRAAWEGGGYVKAQQAMYLWEKQK